MTTHVRAVAVLALFALASVLSACAGGSAVPQAGGFAAPAVVVVPASVHLHVVHAQRLGPRHVFRPRRAHDRRAVLPAVPTPTPTPGEAPLVYNNGPVQTDPSLYVVFWGFTSASGDAIHDPDGVGPYLTKFLGALDCSSWANIVTQYYQLPGPTYITNPCTDWLKGVYVDSSPPPNPFTFNELANEATTIASHYALLNANANIVVVTPTGYQESGNAGYGTFCAYHSWAYMSGVYQPFTLLPYVPDAGVGCGVGSVNNPGTLDGVSVNAGHEVAETITDPEISAWYEGSHTAPYCSGADASSYCEVADKCSWWGLQDTSFGGTSLGVNDFPTQPLWSNATDTCVQSYGTTATPSPSPTPALGPVRLDPRALKFAQTGGKNQKGIVVRQSNFAGKFAHSGNCTGITLIRAVSDAGGRGAYKVTPLRAGNCSMTFVGGGSASAVLHVTVQ